jgi:hypothetical protein
MVERATGIEPAFSAWEADVLPLYDARVTNSVRAPMLAGLKQPGHLANAC